MYQTQDDVVAAILRARLLSPHAPLRLHFVNVSTPYKFTHRYHRRQHVYPRSSQWCIQALEYYFGSVMDANEPIMYEKCRQAKKKKQSAEVGEGKRQERASARTCGHMRAFE
ncbi:hypothetical protein Y032_0100g3282 [Ancylostoma ceylanicum]|uniref:Uncharacterized protein n=1 Tax=Ancylostoma ceylanicum TaxID=53326 RepID=A0A016THF4_9BILA|nr:hypothetical protein Y032_0100g3282 [Ancylostoma ceylanicum]